MPACSSKPTRSCRRIATAVLSTAPGRSAPTRGNTGNATGNASAPSKQKFVAQKRKGNPYAGFVFEPAMQGAAGMIPQPETWLKQVSAIARGEWRIAHRRRSDDRFGGPELKAESPKSQSRTLFASHHENVQPDFLCLAKGLTGGYLPMAATLTTQKVFDAFLGEYHEFKTFFHGHSYTGNQLGAAASLASLEILQSEKSIRARAKTRNRPSRRIEIALATAQCRRHPAGRPDCRNRTCQRLAHPRAICPARVRRNPRLRGDVPARRPHPPRRQCHCPDAAVLHDAKTGATNGSRAFRFNL